MLTPEQAEQRLKEFQDPQYERNQLKRINRLGGELATIGQILAHVGPAWLKVDNDRAKMNTAVHNAIVQLIRQKPAERRKLFQALFPPIADQVEAAWNLFDLLPYQTSYNRRPFRMPGQPAPEARVRWLQRLMEAVKGYDQEVAWFAAWAPYLSSLWYFGAGAPDALGYLFAGTIESGGPAGQQVFEILVASAEGSHAIGVMGRHVVRGLLCASRPDGWAFIERLLLAAQREEGLRQVILESLDEAHPQAFRRLLRLVMAHNLSRFSAAVRAFDVWFGLALETVSQKTLQELLGRVLVYLDDPPVRAQAIQAGSPQEAYLALWAAAFDDAQAAVPQAIALRRNGQVGQRFAAVHLLGQMWLVDSYNELLKAMADPDLRVAACAVASFDHTEYNQDFVEGSGLFESLESLIARLPRQENTFQSPVWDWLSLKIDRRRLAGRLVRCLGKRPARRLIPYLPGMQPDDRASAIQVFSQAGQQDQEIRQALLALAGDPSRYVREKAIAALKEFTLSEAETPAVEDLLRRKPGDLRRGALQLLLGLPDRELLQSTGRLLDKPDEYQRRAGLELLQECLKTGRLQRECRQLAENYRARAHPVGLEARLLDDLLAGDLQETSLDDALGLMDPHNRTSTRPPAQRAALFGRRKRVALGTAASAAVLQSLDELVETHRVEPVELALWDTQRTELLGNVRFGFPTPDPSRPLEDELARLPLRELWESWWQSRPPALHDPDGCELLRALALLQLMDRRYLEANRAISQLPKERQGFFDVRMDFKLHYQGVIEPVLRWLIWSHPAPNEQDFLVEALEASLSRLPDDELTGVKESWYGGKSRDIPFQKLAYLQTCRWHRNLQPEAWQAEHHARLWAVVRWLDEPKAGIPRHPPQIEDALYAYEAGAATRDDLLDLLLGAHHLSGFGPVFAHLRQFSGRKLHPVCARFPVLDALVDECRERILAIEVRRADLPTAATRPALSLASVPGADHLFQLLKALGKADIDRNGGGQSRRASLSSLIRVTYPLPEDTPEHFTKLAGETKIPERRLVELAVYAPQWAGYVEAALNWPKLAEAVYWLYAHTKDRQWRVEKEIRELWTAQVSEYTPLTSDSLMDGAVDVGWFHQVYAALGEARWQLVYRAALLTASGSGHMRARVFADAMLGKLQPDGLIERLRDKRHQDSVRALGLVPLPENSDQKQAQVLRRYEVLQEFLRTGKKFGSQRQASEKLAASIGLQNLARTAGFADPQRLEWAMEVQAVADLAEGPLAVSAGEVQVALAIDELGEPQLSVSKNGKPLKSIPAAVKKLAPVADLLERRKQLDRQTSRMRQSLEAAMCRGDRFSAGELQTLFRHSLLAAMLAQLIFCRPGGMGYPVQGGLALETFQGETMSLSPGDELQIAHPVDLLAGGDWHHWQHECFVAERIQPFKQVYRELYLLTAAEQDEGILSRRYAGQQVNPRQALALFGSRGWVADPQEGVHKTFHNLGLTARVGFLQGMFTPAEVEGLTLEAIAFTRRGDWKPLPLAEIPARMFSEVMRDLDLVVSVAHAGGVDPEASAPSIEARTALVQETCSLLGLENVEVKHKHALVNGKLGHYTIHLGSAVVHKQPGGAVCIVPVHAQQRGRLFLPFVENDPKTAEVVSKIILLARDDQIKDPTILEQILRG